MPRKFSIADKKKWLAQYDNGKSEVSIAKGSKCDARTVKKGIQEARREQDAQMARAELLKHALIKHQDNLLESLRGILASITLPSRDWEPLSWYHEGDSVFDRDIVSIESLHKPHALSAELLGTDTQADMAQAMLEQHLKRDKLWKHLAQWQKACDDHRAKRTALQLKAAVILQEKTGCRMIDRDVDEKNRAIKPPFLYSYTTGPLLFKMALHYAFGDHDADKWQSRVVADTGTHHVKYGPGTILAEVPGEEEKCRQKILNAFNEIKSSPELKETINSFRNLESIMPKVRQIIEEILILELVPGRCDVCERLGM